MMTFTSWRGGWRGRLITSDISLMGHGVGPLTYALGSSSRSTKVNLTWQQLWQLFGSHLKHSASLLGSAAMKNLCLRQSQTAAARSLVGPYHGSCVRDVGQGRMTFPAGTGILLLWSSGVDLGLDSGNAPGCWPESLVLPLPSWPCQRSQGRRSWPTRKC